MPIYTLWLECMYCHWRIKVTDLCYDNMIPELRIFELLFQVCPGCRRSNWAFCFDHVEKKEGLDNE